MSFIKYLKRESVSFKYGLEEKLKYLRLAYYAKIAEIGDEAERQKAIDDFYTLLQTVDEDKRQEIIRHAFINSGVVEIFNILDELDKQGRPIYGVDIARLVQKERDGTTKVSFAGKTVIHRQKDGLSYFEHPGDKKERKTALVIIGKDDGAGNEGAVSGERRAEILIRQGYNVVVADHRFSLYEFGLGDIEKKLSNLDVGRLDEVIVDAHGNEKGEVELDKLSGAFEKIIAPLEHKFQGLRFLFSSCYGGKVLESLEIKDQRGKVIGYKQNLKQQYIPFLIKEHKQLSHHSIFRQYRNML